MPDSVGAGGFPRNINIGHEHLDMSSGFTYQYQGGVPTNILSWKIINGVSATDPSTSGWRVNQLGSLWYNASLGVYRYWNGIEITSIISIASRNKAYQSSLYLVDDFVSGGITSGTIGTVGLQANTSSSSFQPSEQDHPGIFRRDTTAAANTVTSTYLYSSNTLFSLVDGLSVDLIWINRLNNVDANTTCRVGFRSSIGVAQPVDGIYFEKLDADTNWFIVNRFSNVQTRQDTGIIVDANFHEFETIVTLNSVAFLFDRVPIAVLTSNIPTNGINPSTQLINSAAASKTHDIDFFELFIQGYNR